MICFQMNLFIYHLFFYILISIKSTHHLSTGAPPSACGSMIPGHEGVSPQSCSTNYLIQSDKTQYFPNETVRLTVSGATNSNTFRGVLLIAKTQNSGQIIGSWAIVGSALQTLACDGIPNTGVTHTSASDKTSIEAVWSPPLNVSTENTIIRATVVQVYNRIYVNCFSITLTNRQNNQSSNGTTIIASSSSTTALTATVLPTIATQTSTTGVNISWTYANGVTTVKMSNGNLGTSQGFAFGLSLDAYMGEDHVFVCKRLSDDTVTVERRINPSGHSPPVLASTMSNPGGTFTPTSQKLDNGVVYCEFTLSNFSNSKRRRRAISPLSQTATYQPLIAIANLDSSNQLTQHSYRSALSQSVQLNQQETIVSNTDSTDGVQVSLMKAHGIIMIFTWILFVSTAILIAWYFKPAWPEVKIFGKPIWFILHTVLMTSVSLLTIIAFILILVFANGKWISQDYGQPIYAHSIVGVIVVCFAIIQPIMALFRCKPDAEYRFIFNYVHGFVGLTAFILSIVAIMLAMFFPLFNFEKNKDWGIVVAWICWLPIIFLIFWFIEFYFRKYQSPEDNTASYDMGNAPLGTTEETPKRYQVKQDRIKLVFLIIHILVALGLSLALASLVGQL